MGAWNFSGPSNVRNRDVQKCRRDQHPRGTGENKKLIDEHGIFDIPNFLLHRRVVLVI